MSGGVGARSAWAARRCPITPGAGESQPAVGGPTVTP
jgi:hypothetical protein